MKTQTEVLQQQQLLESYQNQEAALKQEMDKFRDSDDPHAQRMLKRHERMLAELRETMKAAKPADTKK